MAYLDPAAMLAAAAGRVAVAEASTTRGAPAFSALEWSVIALARNESLRSLVRPDRLSRAIGGLFGLGESSPLADPALEALRRAAVYAWHRGFALPLREIDRFLAAGYDEAQLEAMVTSITGLRIGDGRRSRRRG